MKHFSEADFLQFLSHSIFTNLLKLCFNLVMWHVFCVPIIKCPSLLGSHGQWLKCAVGHSSVSKLKAHILQPLYLGWLTVNARSPGPTCGLLSQCALVWSGLAASRTHQHSPGPTTVTLKHCACICHTWGCGQYTFENLYSTNFRDKLYR